MITTEAGLMELTRMQTYRGEFVLVSTRVVPSSSFQGRGASVELSNIHSDSSVVVMPSVVVPKPSSIAGSVGAELLTVGVSHTPGVILVFK